MKKVSFFLMAAMAIVFASCGNKTQSTDADADSVKCFEQEQIEASIRVQLDSIASTLSGLKALPFISEAKNGQIQLTEEEKQVKPDYLLDPAVAEDAVTLSEKYRVLVALSIDQTVAELYGMNVDAYNEATAKLIADINDPGFRIFAESGDLAIESQEIYDAEAEAGRINYFWQAVATSIVEQLFIITQNTEKFMPSITDEAADNLTYRIALLQDAIERLTAYDPDLVEVSEAIKPLQALNATSAAEMQQQLEAIKGEIAQSRDNLLK